MNAPSRRGLRWHSCKWRLTSWIFAHLLPHRAYAEPFGGAVSLLLREALTADHNSASNPLPQETPMKTLKQFWMVMGDGPPTYRHDNQISAAMEAKRLARTNPGVEFVVLEAVATAFKNDVDFTVLRPSRRAIAAETDEGDLPF
ncbi:hypothetical protein OSH11_13820 [Kaistia dalseonensis]|uniref:Uncharacterized protein n=1 Tax=Kaistia dalseonensis TaxID=410840 RepID=A0ABU0H950_9HYPH|nr:hypothetical protein [Kaistia dalseonensis]MCX5495787.1 hypothetical protein [Kaistia dalseonensis]MDQ0438388.1 hypothetical protein [Kaistia dalseonensis]